MDNKNITCQENDIIFIKHVIFIGNISCFNMEFIFLVWQIVINEYIFYFIRMILLFH